MADALPLGPWPLGVDNVHDTKHRVFQIPGQGAPPARLTAAENVDLTDEGWPRARLPARSVRPLLDATGLWELDGTLYVQDAGDFGTVDPRVTLITGLTQRVSAYRYGRRAYITDGTGFWELDGTTVRTWGLPYPTVSLAAASGTRFEAGTYIVQATFSDELGNEGGCSSIASITLSTAANITATVSGGTDATVGVNLYVSGRDQPTTNFAAQAPTTGASTIVSLALPTTLGDPPRTRLMQGPPTGLVGLAGWRSHLLGWRDNVVFLSEAFEPHLFHQESIWQFDANVTAAQGLLQGVWVGTERGLYWVSGEDRYSVIPKKVTDAPVLEGSIRLGGELIAPLQSVDPVALFVSTNGVIAGLSSGEVVLLTNDRYHVSSGTRASFAYINRSGLRQLLIAVN